LNTGHLFLLERNSFKLKIFVTGFPQEIFFASNRKGFKKISPLLDRSSDLIIQRLPLCQFMATLVQDCSIFAKQQERNAMMERMEDDSTHFQSILQLDVPKGREGKHKKIVTQLLNDIERLQPKTALKIPLDELPDTKENIRSALNRATRLRGIEVATSSDADFLYVWKVDQQS
jgi:hypothetical protein